MCSGRTARESSTRRRERRRQGVWAIEGVARVGIDGRRSRRLAVNRTCHDNEADFSPVLRPAGTPRGHVLSQVQPTPAVKHLCGFKAFAVRLAATLIMLRRACDPHNAVVLRVATHGIDHAYAHGHTHEPVLHGRPFPPHGLQRRKIAHWARPFFCPERNLNLTRSAQACF
jgi:hypothetical protein